MKNEFPIDDVNCAILNILQENSNITNQDLAKAIGISPAASLERVRKLEKNGLIKNYVAQVDLEKAGKGTMVFVSLSMENHQSKSIKLFWKRIQEVSEVLECYHTAGSFDYLLKVVVKDIKDYENFLTNTLLAIPNIRDVKSTFVLSTVKHENKVSLDPNK